QQVVGHETVQRVASMHDGLPLQIRRIAGTPTWVVSPEGSTPIQLAGHADAAAGPGSRTRCALLDIQSDGSDGDRAPSGFALELRERASPSQPLTWTTR
ncbi:MAG: hypothetical protein LC808_33885, partial [Actinobacteria bacterium]|nr:hypothetical protein [Actinomycetota bacterium]